MAMASLIGMDGRRSTIKFREKYVRLGETDYEFVIDRYGRSLKLKPLAEKTAADSTPASRLPRAGFLLH